MHVTLRHLRAAVAVARQGSFRRAAETVHLSQPALSLAISELEGALGVSLFDRTSRSVATTDIGASFVQGAARVLSDFDQLVQEVGDIAQSRRGRVVVSSVSSLAGRVLPLAIQACAQRFPQIEVVLRDEVAQEALQAVHAREADFAMTTEPMVVGPDAVFEAMHADPFHIVCERTHRFARRRQVRWRELQGETLIMLSTSSGSFQVVHDEMVRQAIRPARSTQVSHLATVHGMLESGFGIAVLPAIALPVAEHPTLVARPLVAPKLARTVGAYRRRDRALSPAAQGFLDVLREVLQGMAPAS